jgi:hypothetical protein
VCRCCRVQHAIRNSNMHNMRHTTCTTTDATWLAEVAATRRTRLQLRAALGCNNETHSVARHFPPILQARERAVAEQRGHAQSLEAELVATRRKLSVRCALRAARAAHLGAPSCNVLHRCVTCCTVVQHHHVSPSCNIPMLHRHATSPCFTVVQHPHVAPSCNITMLHRRATSPCCTVLALSCNMSAT